MQTREPLKYTTLNKLEKTKQSLSSNHNIIKESQLKDKLYKQLKELAEEMINTVQYVINHRGYYKGAGKQEVIEFMSIIETYGVRWNKHQRDNLIRYISKLVNKLIY